MKNAAGVGIGHLRPPPDLLQAVIKSRLLAARKKSCDSHVSHAAPLP